MYASYRCVETSPRREDFYERWYPVVVPDALNIVACCTKCGRGVSVDSGNRKAGNHVSRRQVITFLPTNHLFLLVVSRNFYLYGRVVCRPNVLQSGVSSTPSKTRRDVVASRETNLRYPKPYFGVDTKDVLAFGNFVVNLSWFFVKKSSFILFFFTSYAKKSNDNVRIKTRVFVHRRWYRSVSLY